MCYFYLILAAALPSAALAQLGLPPVGRLLPSLGSTLPRLPDAPVAEIAGDLARLRVDRLKALIARHPRDLEFDPQGHPAVRGEVLLTAFDEATLRTAGAAGFQIIERGQIEGTDVSFARLAVPAHQTLARAIKRLRKLAPGADISANPLHFESGAAGGIGGSTLAEGGAGSPAIGIIDGGVAALPGLTVVEQRGFAAGAPVSSSHGTAVASLIGGSDRVRGGAPGAPLLAADVYGRDPKGGNALAIARALGWMTQRGARVVAISLVGPPNPLLAATIGAVQRKGVSIVAAVGNDGPAAPPAYPASYSGVIAVTGVDGRNRPLIEAGRATHLDFAAPGGDMLAAGQDGRLRPVRGTSFAVPLVAGRLLRAGSLPALARQAQDLGPKGPDKVYGHGLVCGDCRTARD